MLSCTQFSLLSLNDRAQYLWEHGTFLLCYFRPEGAVSLYAVEDFFAELSYDVEANRIVDVEGFTGLDRLHGHAEAIDLSQLTR